ncbi:MAG: type III-A CRISPR-associated RAMP protein Csm3 [Phycisphaerae bacterium]|nr:type III-A CRISPR-associated RAMP protein Csm3 [Bacilli bacterium]
MKLINTKKIEGVITIETGLHIGGAKNSLDIGGLDTPVIKTPAGVPYIPGSSLKGKIRSLLALSEGCADIKEESELLKKMFGYTGDNNNDKTAQKTRLIFRDAHLDKDHFKNEFDGAVLETPFTESKYENTIDRTTGKTKGGGLRQLERVPVGAQFNFEVIINAFDGDDPQEMEDELHKGLKMLEDNYLGGSGTRGYGKVKLEIKAKS